jgi:DNA-binding CsgD family transcriptional regulator
VSIILKTVFPNLTAGNALERVWLRGKPWLIDEERHLRLLVEEGKSFSDISQVMGKSRTSVKNKLYNLGLSLKDNTQPQFPVAVSSLSSSSKAPIINPAPPNYLITVNEVAPELKTTGPLPSVEEKLRVLDAALVALERKLQRPPQQRDGKFAKAANVE